MELHNIKKLLDEEEILSNGEFDSLGLAVSVCNERLLTFAEQEKYVESLNDNIKCLITTKEIGEKYKDKYGIIVSDKPRMTYFKLHNKLAQENSEYRRPYVESTIGEGCNISNSASISKNNVKIGNNVIIEEFVVIRENIVIGDNCIIRSGVILGGEGYEFKRVDGEIMNVIHCGGVIIENNVEVQYNATIDKALYTWDDTIIGEYTKLDNLVHIEHGVKVGRCCLIASNTTIGGRTVIGNDSWVGLNATISNGLVLGDKVSVSLGAVVTKSLENGEKVSGNFAINHDKYINHIKNIR